MDSSRISIGLRIAIVIGITFLLPLTVYYGVAAYSPQPDYPTYPSPSTLEPTVEEQQQARDRYQVDIEAYETEMGAFATTLFWVAAPLGFAAMGLGAFRGLGDIGTGFLLGGIATLGIVQADVSHYLSDLLRFLSLLIGLMLLIVIAWRRLYAKQ